MMRSITQLTNIIVINFFLLKIPSLSWRYDNISKVSK